jgi:hypothetical protein
MTRSIARLRPTFCTVLAILALAGCATTQAPMVKKQYDGKSETIERRVYTKYFDAGGWLEEGKLGLQVVVEQEKSAVPLLYSLNQMTGIFGSSDAEARGNVTLVFWNLDGEERTVKIVGVKNLRPPSAIATQQTVKAIGRKRSPLTAGVLKMLDSATEFKVEVEYEIDGATGKKELILKRRTEDELARFFGPAGRPPYPWFEAPYYQPSAQSR